jgi:hypothetical protein
MLADQCVSPRPNGRIDRTDESNGDCWLGKAD